MTWNFLQKLVLDKIVKQTGQETCDIMKAGSVKLTSM